MESASHATHEEFIHLVSSGYDKEKRLGHVLDVGAKRGLLGKGYRALHDFQMA